MPYQWKTPPTAPTQELRLWPHQSLPAKGFAAFILTTFAFILIPTLALLGTPVLWGLLPFAMAALAGVYFALQSNYKARQIEEVLTLSPDTAHLIHTTAKGEVKEWECNRYWTIVTRYEKGGPVPYYITLRGKGREVEIGKFLSEDERKALFDELNRSLLR
ncbi:DUF2244 domain-containing protein [Sulfitobacter sp.]|jgi:uncharacterized membrane protein|uniref:DUF2244 domain-containing protein n=1 Tax=Sulfitobacter sp. TaxID=1903071 RepID=UPI000C0D44A7|nr:hypothetical protein [Roseobacter sp.]MBV50738.1 hypothetical protein [Roseobacter sp.]PHR08457.1 MAG: hypothetical protein COB29_07470 [Sulfitobacter sp.]|tara:strand:- start:14520 stop:15002 length:483 start_codon:yes stop_codon:yes gene_type:complete